MDSPDGTLNRRDFLTGIGAAGALALGGSHLHRARHAGHLRHATHLNERGREIMKAATGVKAAGSDIGAVKHVVFLMQENRSFDHYFGTMKGVHGFNDTNNRGAFTQDWPGGTDATLLPFRLDVKKYQAECTYDLSHAWTAEHTTVNGGAMDKFVSTHTSLEGSLGTVTMGYYEKADIPFYYDLADKFTICDQYHCSVLGPTHPNRLMQMTGTLDPAGDAGGPVIVTNDFLTTAGGGGVQGTCSWTTMAEVLQNANISWKCYNPYGPNYQPGMPGTNHIFANNNVLSYFNQIVNAGPSSPLYQRAFSYFGPNVNTSFSFTATNPNTDDFTKDVANNQLPAVSWVFSPAGYDEHPPAPAQLGEWFTQQILGTLTSNQEVWESTVLFIMYDENDGFFDHVPPPLPPAATPGEYLTVDPLPSSAGGTAGPIGLGVRVPMLVVSPFSVGGYLSSEVFDHTSQLKFLSTLFDVSVPNISSWRNSTVGDLTSTLPLGSPDLKVQKFKAVSDSISAAPIGTECAMGQLEEIGNPKPQGSNFTIDGNAANPVAPPKHQKMPKQARGTLKSA